MLRRWGRRSELQFFGSKRQDRDFWEPLDGIHYDNQFIFDELAWNFEPSELGAAFGLEQLQKLPENLARRRRHFARYSDALAAHADRIGLPHQLADLETAWLGYPLMIGTDAGFERADLQEHLDARGIDTRTIWTGNVTRQPMLGGIDVRVPPDGLPEADAVMERGVLLPLSHAIDDDTLEFVIGQGEEFLAGRTGPGGHGATGATSSPSHRGATSCRAASTCSRSASPAISSGRCPPSTDPPPWSCCPTWCGGPRSAAGPSSSIRSTTRRRRSVSPGWTGSASTTAW